MAAALGRVSRASYTGLRAALAPAGAATCNSASRTLPTVASHKLSFSTSCARFAPAVTQHAPYFKGTAVTNGEFKEISLEDYKGKYLVLFFYPLDFTFVCPTEIIAFSDKASEFHNVNCEVVGVSVDSHFSHLAWINTPRKSGGLGHMNIPLLSDLNKQVSRDYGVLLEGPGIALSTFVCPTEIIAFSDKASEFHNVNCEVVGVSVDSHFSHLAWINTPRKSGGLGHMNIPLLSDLNKQVSRDYGVLLEGPGIALRGLFIIDPNGVVKHISVNDLPVGRCVQETLRLVKAFQFVETHGEVCPANWTPDSPTIKPSPEGSKEYFEKVNE
ncbi:Thioredoxin-dependent peroxide reductase, mitochondrial [Acipenser ruthenus]|uniref:Thioredoxin-dependent peroxide reductase, mitochondrial n=1 Tax=Acipenser ruthenus TaxID=7906 RepID=A0A444ULT8_ACIRT|nr:Thioredoxin-dependent peroxide reductase, mitochondrial [Acipenser ruthenus]